MHSSAPRKRWRAIALSFLAAALLACLCAATAQATIVPNPSNPTGQNTTDGRYIVVLDDGTAPKLTSVLGDHADMPGLEVLHVYDDALDGYVATVPDELLPVLRADERVAHVEKDRILEVEAARRSSRQALPWGVGAIDADASSTRAGNGSGSVSGVNVYVIDTGIAQHGDLNVLAPAAFNATGDGKAYDCMGHGTHVAGTIAARDNRRVVVGAAPGAPLTGVKVFGCDGSGTTSGVIAGIEWVTANAQKPAVANMSLGGGTSYAMDLAVQNSVRSGVFYTVAAGNDGADACTMSPARAGKGEGVLTVGATTRTDTESSFSNYGACVDLWAPGSGIVSTWHSGGTATLSGTSMAAPHAAAAAALYLSRNPTASPAAVEARLETDAVSTGTTSKANQAIKRLNARGY